MNLEPFKRATPNPATLTVEHWLKRGLTADEAASVIAELKLDVIWLNNVFQVNVRELPNQGAGWPTMIHLSIKRRDKKPVRDWRTLQQIKNAIVGPECEGVELFPAESRLVDTANQFHIWCLKDPNARFPFGYVKRAVSGAEAARAMGAKQRELPEGTIETPEPDGIGLTDVAAP